MPMLSFLVPLIMQVGIAPTASPVSAVPPELRDRPTRNAPALDRPASDPAIQVCLDTARNDPEKARALAEEWVSRTRGLQRAAGRHCLGVAAGNAGDWSAAAAAFLAARDEAPDGGFRARMSALAASAFLANEQPAEALAAVDGADTQGDAALAGTIAIDRATALVALGRNDEAGAALAAARAATPDDPQAWLLSATLARRTGDLATAQAQIERAAALDPRDPAIGLEAGVIAALGGRDDAARKSFDSVVAAAPDSAQAAAAKQYLAQLGGR
jgi:tetratricopeptide (TPR) repeat protein